MTPKRGSAKEAKSIAHKQRENMGLKEFSETMKQFGQALKIITDNSEGGELRLLAPNGQELVFSIPSLPKRQPPTEESLKHSQKALEKFLENNKGSG